MKSPVEKRKPSGIVDYIALSLTTWFVGWLPGAPGTYGSMVAVIIYLVIGWVEWGVSIGPKYHGGLSDNDLSALFLAVNAVLLLLFCLVGIWASGRSIPLLGSDDPSEAVVDELMGQFITFCFIPFGVGWPFVLAGFLLFRLFDIWKPFPIRDLEVLPGGLGICADDLVAGVYAGVCLSVVYAVYLAI